MVGAIIFSVGMFGFMLRRNLIVLFLSVEMMLQGVSLSLVAWGAFHNNWDGQILALMIIAVAACEAGVGLALVLVLYQRSGSLDIVLWQNTREEGQPPYLDREVPESADVRTDEWPQLTPAGKLPQVDPEEFMHRSRV